MNNQTLKQRVLSILQSELNVDPSTVNPDADLRDQVHLDSMQFVSLIARLEIDLRIEVPMSILEVKTLNEFLEAIERESEKAAR
jgi:acyl carrier protein